MSGWLNIRSAPSLSGEILARAPVGTTFENKGCDALSDRDWCELVLPDGSGQRGWAAAEYLAPINVRTRAANGEFDRIGKLDCRSTGEPAWARCDFGLALGEDGNAALVAYLSTETRLLLLWDKEALWLASQKGDRRLEPKAVDDALSVTFDDFEVSFPQSLLSAD